MKKGILSMAVFLIAVMMVFGLAGRSYAQEQTDGGPASAMIFTYYDVRSVAEGGLGLTDNYFTIINTSGYWVQSHVRIRTGDCSVELLDFDILQSPKDNFVFDIYPDGGITFASCDTNTLEDSGFNLNFDADGDGDNDCFILSSDTFPAMLSLITTCGNCATGGTITTAEAAELVKKGYVEVIEEGSIHPKTSDETLCYTPDAVSIPGKTLRALYDTECSADIYASHAELQGRQYYVEVDTSVSPVIVKRLAQTNAAVVDGTTADIGVCTHGLILHEDNYAAELASDQCNGGDGTETRCYAYAAPETPDGAGATADGANDMNWCFYADEIGGDKVINKFGAAATFGPTLVDIVSYHMGNLPRDGSLAQTAGLLAGLSGLSSFNMNMATQTMIDLWTKQYVDSHYFYAPSPGHYDMTTAFAFVFPVKHFTGEKETIQAVEIYDNMENTTTIEIGKFISPGLPTPETFAEEAELFKLTPPFNEGWIRFEVSATNSTTGCDENDDTTVDCEVGGYDIFLQWVSPPSTEYVPPYLGLVFTTGSENLGVSPFTYNNENITEDFFGNTGDVR